MGRLNIERFDYDIPRIRSEMEAFQKDGVRNFVVSLKKNDRFYSVMGKFWRSLLPESAAEYISTLQKRHHLTYRKS